MSAETDDSQPWHDAETLRRLYIEEELTQPEVAERLGTTRRTVRRWIARHGIDTDQRRGVACDPADLRRLYEDEGLSQSDIAERYDVSERTVWRWCGRFDIDTRQTRSPTVDGDELEALWSAGQTVADIADRYDVTRETVRGWLRDHDLDYDPTPTDTPGYRDPDTLSRLFHGEDLSPPAIAERFDVAASTVRKWVQRFDIREEPARRAPPSAETLQRLHHEEHLSLPEISDELGRSTPSVEWWMGKHNIEIVNRQGYRYTHDELLDELREYSRDGIDETKRHLSETDAAPDPDRFARRFGSFAAAWYRAGFEIPPQDDDAGLTNDQSRTLQTERTAAKNLPAPDEVVARCELQISTSAFRRFTENRILVKAFRERVLETADGTTRWRWRVAPGVHEWVETNLTNTTECPGEGCHATGIHNPRDVDGYQCTNDTCDETFGREVAEEVMGG